MLRGSRSGSTRRFCSAILTPVAIGASRRLRPRDVADAAAGRGRRLRDRDRRDPLVQDLAQCAFDTSTSTGVSTFSRRLAPAGQAELHNLVGDATKARQRLGWEPNGTSLRSCGCSSTPTSRRCISQSVGLEPDETDPGTASGGACLDGTPAHRRRARLQPGAAIAANVATIRDAIAAGLGAPFELIVVSDGSIDGTAERALEARPTTFASSTTTAISARATRSRSGRSRRAAATSPTSTPTSTSTRLAAAFVERAEEADLDFAIGSKRHPDSEVHYPRPRRVYSWLYQQLVRLLFRLDVRDTQVGLKVFRREVAEQVFPLLLVKRFAFDLELLAVSRALGFDHRGAAVRLDYRFTGSGVSPLAVGRALVDTAAIFYRLRILRYYQRKRALGGAFGWTRPRGFEPLVSVVTAIPTIVSGLDYPHLEVILAAAVSPAAVRAAAAGAAATCSRSSSRRLPGRELDLRDGPVPRPWRSSPSWSPSRPARGSLSQPAAAAVGESRLGGGSLYFRFTPGNLRYVDDFPGSVVVDAEAVPRARRAVATESSPRTSATGHRCSTRRRRSSSAPARRSSGPISRGDVRLRPPTRRPCAAAASARSGRTTLLPVALLAFFALGPCARCSAGVFIWLPRGRRVLCRDLGSGVSRPSLPQPRVGGLAAAGLVPTHPSTPQASAGSPGVRLLILNWRDIRSPRAGGAEVLTHEIANRLV